MTKILFPTDFSKTAKNAFLYALHLANTLNFEIKLVSVHSSLTKHLEIIEENFNSHIEGLIKLAKDNELEHVKIESSMIIGDLLLTILEIIDSNDIDFVVMGTNGENSFDKKLFGSNTVNVINNSPVPVLAVPSNVHYKKERNFAYATLFSEKENNAIQEMLRFTTRNDTTLKIVHVENKLLTQDMLATKEYWENNYQNIQILIENSEDVETGLINFCRRNKIDVLGITHRELSFLKRFFSTNHSNQLIEIGDIAIVVFRES